MPAPASGPDRDPGLALTLPPPVVVGGSGGSGTRVVAQLLRETGVDMGRELNGAGDAMPMVPLYRRHAAACWLGEADLAALRDELWEALPRHLHCFPPAGPWGWKNPASIYVLPALDRLLPGMRFVHVVRHGLDMATSTNQNQLRKYGAAVLGAEWRRLPVEKASARLWAEVNLRAADYGRSMGGRYFLLRYEDLCRDRDGMMARLCAAFALPRPADGWRTPIEPRPPRWPSLAPELRKALAAHIAPALQRFGYPC